jgi:hypothetical protein
MLDGRSSAIAAATVGVPPAHAADLSELRALFEDDPSAVVSFITSEHFTLQTARANTINEANGRATIYLMSVSSAVVALAFIGQVAKLGTAFFVFAFVLLPALFFVGVVTFDRVLQSSIEDGLLAMRINRLRRFYLDFGPGLGNYLATPVPEDDRRKDVASTLAHLRRRARVAAPASPVLGRQHLQPRLPRRNCRRNPTADVQCVPPRPDTIRHTWGSELLYAPADGDQEPAARRHARAPLESLRSHA